MLQKLKQTFDLSTHDFGYIGNFEVVKHQPGPRQVITDRPYMTDYDLPELNIQVKTYRNLFLVDPELVTKLIEKIATITTLTVHPRHITLLKVFGGLKPHKDQIIKSAIIFAVRDYKNAVVRGIIDPQLEFEGNFQEASLRNGSMAVLDVSELHSLETDKTVESWTLQVAFDDSYADLIKSLK